MLKNKRLFHFLMLTSLMAFMASCSYDFIEYPYVAPPDPNDTVYFAEKIVPIFSTDDKCTSCHKPGATNPDLTAANAYNSIVPALINTTDAEASSIYWFPNPNSTTHMWKKLSTSDADLILLWIQQGALNN